MRSASARRPADDISLREQLRKSEQAQPVDQDGDVAAGDNDAVCRLQNIDDLLPVLRDGGHRVRVPALRELLLQ